LDLKLRTTRRKTGNRKGIRKIEPCWANPSPPAHFSPPLSSTARAKTPERSPFHFPFSFSLGDAYMWPLVDSFLFLSCFLGDRLSATAWSRAVVILANPDQVASPPLPPRVVTNLPPGHVGLRGRPPRSDRDSPIPLPKILEPRS
jgi:hypothetical protein